MRTGYLALNIRIRNPINLKHGASFSSEMFVNVRRASFHDVNDRVEYTF